MSRPPEHEPIESTDRNVESEHDHRVIKSADLLRIAFVIVVAGTVWCVPQFRWLGIAGVS